MNCELTLIICILLLFIFANIVYTFCPKRSQISNFEPMNESFSYADTNDQYEKPYVIPNYISSDYCWKLIDYAKDKLFDSEVVGGKNQNIRNSQQCWIHKDHPLVKPLYQKAFQFFHIPIENAEDLQVVRYLPGQYYNEHHDSCCDNNEKCIDFAKKGGQRKLTVLIYLNDQFTDGHTYFKHLNLKLKPPVGSAVVFHPLAKESSKCHPLALHAGMPVSSGEKWIANIWFRENKIIS